MRHHSGIPLIYTPLQRHSAIRYHSQSGTPLHHCFAAAEQRQPATLITAAHRAIDERMDGWTDG